jgi:hypothetical protein
MRIAVNAPSGRLPQPAQPERIRYLLAAGKSNQEIARTPVISPARHCLAMVVNPTSDGVDRKRVGDARRGRPAASTVRGVGPRRRLPGR